MKNNILRNFLFFLFILSILSSCDLFKSDDDKQPTDQYLVSHEKVTSYLPAFIESILTGIGNDFPGLTPIISEIEHGVTVYKINYETTFDGDDIIASGLVSIPTSMGEFPVLSYQNGTNTEHSKAPSVSPDNELFLLLEFMASTGFIVTIPDYLGFGTSENMFHPYLDKESTIQSVLDMQRAVKELVANHLNDEIGLELNNDYYITGYSQGGWTTMQLQKAIEQNYSEAFNLRASACAAGPYDLNYINEYVLNLEDYPMPYFLGYIFNSYYNLDGITTPIEEVFQAPYDSKVLTLYDGTKSGTEINDLLDTKISRLFTAEYINGYNTDAKYASIKDMLTVNSITAWKATTPTLLIHGTKDTFVPPQVTDRIFQNFLSEGVGVDKIKMLPLPGATHQSAAVPAGIAAITWFLEIKKQE